MKAAIYVRVSTGKQEAENQLIQLKNYAQKSDYEIHKEYADIISGKENSRPAFDNLFLDARKKLFDIVLFWDLSRFSRSGTLFTLQRLKELENLGIDWISYQEPYFRSIGDFKDIVISIMATLAKIEREKISERTKAGLARTKAKLGRPKAKINEKKILDMYKEYGSINKVAKLSKWSYGKVYEIIKKQQNCILSFLLFYKL